MPTVEALQVPALIAGAHAHPHSPLPALPGAVCARAGTASGCEEARPPAAPACGEEGRRATSPAPGDAQQPRHPPQPQPWPACCVQQQHLPAGGPLTVQHQHQHQHQQAPQRQFLERRPALASPPCKALPKLDLATNPTAPPASPPCCHPLPSPGGSPCCSPCALDSSWSSAAPSLLPARARSTPRPASFPPRPPPSRSQSPSSAAPLRPCQRPSQRQRPPTAAA